MPKPKLPIVPSREIRPMARLEQKYRTALKILDPSNRRGEMYEIAVGLEAMKAGLLTHGSQIGRPKLNDSEPDQRVRIDSVEVDGLLGRTLAEPLLLSQMRGREKQGGRQQVEATAYAVVDQVDAVHKGNVRKLSGVFVAEPLPIERLNWKLMNNVLRVLHDGELRGKTSATTDDLKEVLDINAKRCGIESSKNEKDLEVMTKDVKSSSEIGAKLFNHMQAAVKRIAGIELVTMRVEPLSEEALGSTLASGENANPPSDSAER